MQQAISKLEHAGKYIVKSRRLEAACLCFTAVDGANSNNPDLQALAVISVALARVVGAQDDGWTGKVCTRLGLQF